LEGSAEDPYSQENHTKFKDLNVENKTIVLGRMSQHYTEFREVMSEEPGGTLQQQRYKAHSTQTWRTWMATAGLIQHMLKCCGSEHEKVMARVPRSDESMRGRLDELLRLSTKNRLISSDRNKIQLWTCSLAVKEVQEEMLKEWIDMWASNTAFYDAAEDDIARWCYILWRVLGYNIASAMRTLETWFSLHLHLQKMAGEKRKRLSI
jgi:hypothetical protein